MSAGGAEMQGHATRRQVIAGVLAQRGVHAGMDAGRTWAAEGHGRRLILCTRNRTDPISSFAKNGDALENRSRLSDFGRPVLFQKSRTRARSLVTVQTLSKLSRSQKPKIKGLPLMPGLRFCSLSPQPLSRQGRGAQAVSVK